MMIIANEASVCAFKARNLKWFFVCFWEEFRKIELCSLVLRMCMRDFMDFRGIFYSKSQKISSRNSSFC